MVQSLLLSIFLSLSFLIDLPPRGAFTSALDRSISPIENTRTHTHTHTEDLSLSVVVLIAVPVRTLMLPEDILTR
jgi:hypothetical protein